MMPVRDPSGVIATEQRKQVTQYWINAGIEDAREALVNDGPEAAVDVLARTVDILLRLGWVPPTLDQKLVVR